MRTRPFSHMVAAAGGEVLLGWRLAVRHGVSRSALVWSVGLSALARLLAGPGDAVAGATLLVAAAGILAAVGAPRLLLGGGARESLRWASMPAAVGATLRLAGVVGYAIAGAAATAVAHGQWPAAGGLVLATAAGHAVLVGALAAGLAPSVGCSGATVLLLMLVAAGVGAGVEGSAPLLAPPGLMLGRVSGVGLRDAAMLVGWTTLAAAALGLASRRAVRVPVRGG